MPSDVLKEALFALLLSVKVTETLQLQPSTWTTTERAFLNFCLVEGVVELREVREHLANWLLVSGFASVDIEAGREKVFRQLLGRSV